VLAMFCSFTLQHLILLQIKPTEISSFSLAILNKLDRSRPIPVSTTIYYASMMEAEVRAISLQLGVVIYDFRQSNQRRMDLTISQIAEAKLNQALDSSDFLYV